MSLLIALVWVINFAISWWNAKACGLVWVETKAIGGWQRFMTWMGAIMSASGFTWCYLIVLLLGAYHGQGAFLKPEQPPILTIEHVKGSFALGYLIIIPGVLFSGLMIWVDSLVQAWRRRDLPSMASAAWNTFAQVHNTYRAIKDVPDALGSVFKLFSGGSSKSSKKDGAAVLLVVILVVLALCGGVITTWSIIARNAGTAPLPDRRRV